MKKRFLAALATGLLMVGLGGVAQAYSILDGSTSDPADTINIGDFDLLLGATRLSDSGLANEISFIQEILGTSYTITDEDKYDVTDTEWYPIIGTADGYAHSLVSDPGWYFIKINADPKNPDAYTHFLFKNNEELDWAALRLTFTMPGTGEVGEEITVDMGSIKNIGKISHIGEIAGAEVPEPATMLLFGTGLAGLAGIARRRNKKNA